MSAWLVSQTHIRALVTYARRNGLHASDADAIGNALWRQNDRSLIARYEDRAAGYWTLGQTYTHRDANLSPLTLLKACDCYDYQACETDDYEATLAGILIAVMQRHICAAVHMTEDQARRQPAYEAAPWGIDDPDQQEAAA